MRIIGQKTLWTYDALGRVIQALSDQGSAMSFVYDRAGRLERLSDTSAGAVAWGARFCINGISATTQEPA